MTKVIDMMQEIVDKASVLVNAAHIKSLEGKRF